MARLPLRHPRAAARPPHQSLGRAQAQRLNWSRAAQHLPRLYCANGEDDPGHRCDEARRIAANIAKLLQGAAEEPTGLYRPHFRYDLNF